jgi:aminopeptidase
MPDPRISKLAKLMVHYSLELKPGDKFLLRTHPLAQELTLAVYEEAVKAGAQPLIQCAVPGTQEIFFKNASDEQLDYVSPVQKMIVETFDASLNLWTETNTRELSGIDPKRMAHLQKTNSELNKIFMQRSAKGELRWCLNLDEPAVFWRKEGENQRKATEWLKGHDKAVLKGSNVDLTMSVKDRVFIPCDGKFNFPDGEIFTGPVEDSANGWIRFRYPAIEYSQEITDIELWFENGKVVKEKASKNLELLTALLNTDAGSRFIGEWGIGTNYGITKFTKNMLFDEKIGGTIHIAVGSGYPESGSKNESGIHWDMLCDMNDAEITLDGDLFYKNGKTAI